MILKKSKVKDIVTLSVYKFWLISECTELKKRTSKKEQNRKKCRRKSVGTNISHASQDDNVDETVDEKGKGEKAVA